ncbi:PREDICTED: uncharacterized protein LOC109581015 isoform X2 [Amphimedon queenslandica]|uniref:Poly [ADP-ribose] polymerase n=1 Tax=Amphimedon queenslandica TaxID=400682 RepID=A0AAN0IZV5_AMPQE|nr:PREDICTED: uncharacterized protein LOC109581015 isoform X2 [Amphimedon queenslandica]|eukprot:XP_019850289.1 PREDICTED: uncharacterized protein LOC109581015 isoform X2 [Amphimedon queenslandica]
MSYRSILLSNEENQDIFTIVGARKEIRATAVAQMYHAHPNPNNWEKFCTGVVCFVKENSQRFYFIQLIDLMSRAVVFEQELYEEFHYSNPRPYFHSFPGHEFMVGLNFASEKEAEKFHAAVESGITDACRASISRRKTLPETKKQDRYSLEVDGSGIGKLLNMRRKTLPAKTKKQDRYSLEVDDKPIGGRKLTKADIGKPTDFRHVGWDPHTGPFDATSPLMYSRPDITRKFVLHCQFIPLLLQHPQVLQNIEQQYGVKFSVMLPNGSTKSMTAFSTTIASMMSGSHPLTIESISDYLSSSSAGDVSDTGGVSDTGDVSDAGGVSWNFFDDHQFQPMSPTDSAEIEKLYQDRTSSHARHQLPYSRKIGEWNYSYDFDSMEQTNTKTQKKRKIKRIYTPPQDLFFLCLSCCGLKDGVQASIDNLREKLEGMIVKKTFGDFGTGIAEPIIQLAKSFCVKVDSSLDSIVISGSSDCLAEVLLVLAEKRMNLQSSPFLSSFPPEWEPQTDNIELKSVPVSSPEGAKVVSAFKKTMNANISKIERIQNKFLYSKYDLCKKRMHEKNNGQVNEKWLFHGSRSVAPETIHKSEHGFDFRHAGQGMWGRGAYFAVNASYSGDSYAFRSSQGQQIFLAFVLTGDSKAMESDTSLIIPPRKEDGRGNYDSVNGLTGGSQVYIVYDHDKCYPAYLITFNY